MGDPNPSHERCRLCSGPLSKDLETSSWTVAPLIRDSFSMIGTAIGGTASAVYGFNHAMPIVRRYQQRVPSYLQSMLLATDRLGVAHLHAMARYSTLCQSCATGGAMPALAQLVSSSYHAAMSSSALAHSSSQEDNMHKRKRSSPL